MTDRELLELAAKAAGYPNAKFQNMEGWGETRYGLTCGMWDDSMDDYWNPLESSADAIKLSIDLRIDIKHYGDHVICWSGDFFGTGKVPYGDDPLAATRRAIVLAAVEIERARATEGERNGND